jgi:hypothetical protein
MVRHRDGMVVPLHENVVVTQTIHNNAALTRNKIAQSNPIANIKRRIVLAVHGPLCSIDHAGHYALNCTAPYQY